MTDSSEPRSEAGKGLTPPLSGDDASPARPGDEDGEDHSWFEPVLRRHFDERLTMFLLRYRDPVRYGRWLDRCEARQHADGPFAILSFRIGRMVRAAWRAFDAALRGEPMPEPEPETVDNGRDDDRDGS